MNPFFSYFGSRWRLSKFYQSPIYETVIEPFAGAAGYSTYHEYNHVILYDTYEKVIVTWQYLIDVANDPAKKEDFLKLPTPDGGFTKNNPIPQYLDGAKYLIGWWETSSQTSPSPYQFSRSRGGEWSERKKEKIYNQLHKIQNWEAHLLSYEQIPDTEATWHIDPPYQKAGSRYVNNTIDYKALGDWVKTRSGQVMVCEQEPAQWLDFKHLKTTVNGSNKKYNEVVWYNNTDTASEADDTATDDPS
jgi:site-specific DNA-adenine methylase